MMDFADVQGWIGAVKDSLGLLKAGAELLPKGQNRSELERRIKAAEDALERSDAKLARELGMKLCDCTFPPQIMLWREAENAHVCPNPECGRRWKPMHISDEALKRFEKPAERHGWMGR
jgi:hypothetical protein